MDKETKIRLLIVEDEEGARKAIARILESLGYFVAEAESGNEALELVKAGPRFDIVFTDLSLPGMSGWDLSKAIMDVSPGTKVAILTGWDVADDDERIAASGVSEILSKPIDMHKMKDVIARMVSTK